jgi:hypothetical protein
MPKRERIVSEMIVEYEVPRINLKQKFEICLLIFQKPDR